MGQHSALRHLREIVYTEERMAIHLHRVGGVRY